MSVRRSIGVFVLALAITGWNCGNVGPVVDSLTHDFDITGYGLSTAAAGGFAFALFGISAVMRDVAGRLTAAGAPRRCSWSSASVSGPLGLCSSARAARRESHWWPSR